MQVIYCQVIHSYLPLPPQDNMLKVLALIHRHHRPICVPSFTGEFGARSLAETFQRFNQYRKLSSSKFIRSRRHKSLSAANA